MNLGRMFELIETALQDDSFTREDYLLPLVNEAVLEASHLVNLPDLQAQDTITALLSASSNTITMPSDYSRELYRAYNTTMTKPVNIRPNIKSLEALYDDDLTETGDVVDVSVEGNTLWYRPLASEDQEISLFYYRDPVPLTYADTTSVADSLQTVDGIPEHLTGYVPDYCLYQVFSLIEDGIEGQKINTSFYQAKLDKWYGLFGEYCRVSAKKRPVIRRTARFM